MFAGYYCAYCVKLSKFLIFWPQNSDFVDDTLNTLKFAERASHVFFKFIFAYIYYIEKIFTKVSPNQINATDDALIQKLQKEVNNLRKIYLIFLIFRSNI